MATLTPLVWQELRKVFDALEIPYLGTWGASALAESDMVFRSIAGYNSRNLFASFMSLPMELRRGSELFDEATVRLAPELAGIPYES